MDLVNIDNDIIFEPKADAVPFNYRISYKVSLICLILHECCGKKGCSATKLQMISFAATSLKSQSELLSSFGNYNDATIVRFDPTISRAINYAIYDNIIFRQGNGLFRLTDKGNEMVSNIFADDILMNAEKVFFKSLSNKLTEDYIADLSKRWGEFNAKN